MTKLTDRMRTCAAFIMSRPHDAPMPTEHLLDDAADLLIEASNILEAMPAPLGEPMEIIPPPPAGFAIDRAPTAMWTAPGDTLPKANPYRSANTCPKCDSRASKTVRRYENRLTLECPACGQQWDYVARS